MPEEAKISKAQQKAVNKYVKNNYDRINVTFQRTKRYFERSCHTARGKCKCLHSTFSQRDYGARQRAAGSHSHTWQGIAHLTLYSSRRTVLPYFRGCPAGIPTSGHGSGIFGILTSENFCSFLSLSASLKVRRSNFRQSTGERPQGIIFSRIVGKTE